MNHCLLFAKVFASQTFSQGERIGLLEVVATASSSEVFFKGTFETGKRSLLF